MNNLGIKKEDIVGKTVMELDFLPLEYRKKHQKADDEVFALSQSITYEEQVKFVDNRTHDLIYSISGFKDFQGEPAGIVGVLVDITHQKENKRELLATMNELKEVHKNMKDSIDYARVIQSSLLSSSEILEKYFQDSCTAWKPKDVVGGDIYFFEEINENECLIFVIDCTGHGVSGALLTVLVKAIEVSVSLKMKKLQGETISPARLLSLFNEKINSVLMQEDNAPIFAGFDGTILYYNKKERLIRFASAHNIVKQLRDGKIIEYKGDRQSIGYKAGKEYIYTDYEIEVKDDDIYFISTDGLYDQTGGTKDIPMGREQVRRVLLENENKPLEDIKSIMLEKLKEYQGNNPRNDDISFVIFKI